MRSFGVGWGDWLPGVEDVVVMGWWSKIKAQKSTTWVPWVLIMRMVCFLGRGMALPVRAGISNCWCDDGGDMMVGRGVE